MHLGHARRRKVRVHWPISPEVFALLIAGDTDSLSDHPALAPLLTAIHDTPELGDFGDYTSVVETSLGYEGFTVGPAATPTLGIPGQRTISPTLVMTTYVDATVAQERLNRILLDLVAAHPWEVPVIELTDAVTLVTAQAEERS